MILILNTYYNHNSDSLQAWRTDLPCPSVQQDPLYSTDFDSSHTNQNIESDSSVKILMNLFVYFDSNFNSDSTKAWSIDLPCPARYLILFPLRFLHRCF